MKVHEYRGPEVVVRYDAGRCIHAGECVRGAPQVFDRDARPWVKPEGASLEHLLAVIARCPTGALTAVTPDGAPLEAPAAANVASVQPRGPIYLRGRITVRGADHASWAEYTRIALCRCGASANKPFCDGSHTQSGFADGGTCPGAPASVEGRAEGPIKVNPIDNGPLMIEGAVEFDAADGSTFVTDKVWLCRCGHSGNKPFCDGTHKRIGFRSS
ncbi:MAG TPA: CDGSH iron-sulfur domain-containing protein [Burkholderiaceae bacterium]|nr:CDGSH iron-sulfur domain-containing protein [Burkholderiaceae bacterium]